MVPSYRDIYFCLDVPKSVVMWCLRLPLPFWYSFPSECQKVGLNIDIIFVVIILQMEVGTIKELISCFRIVKIFL